MFNMANFGFVTEKGSHGENIFFGPDNYDEACIGIAGWDLLRFLTSPSLRAKDEGGANIAVWARSPSRSDRRRQGHRGGLHRPRLAPKASRSTAVRAAAADQDYLLL